MRRTCGPYFPEGRELRGSFVIPRLLAATRTYLAVVAFAEQGEKSPEGPARAAAGRIGGGNDMRFPPPCFLSAITKCYGVAGFASALAAFGFPSEFMADFGRQKSGAELATSSVT